jgi:predicted Zn-dependent peptidase
VAAAGSIDHDRLVELVAERLPDVRVTAPQAEAAPGAFPARVRFKRKDTEQYHVALGAPGLTRHDDRRFALRILDGIFGGTSSSRLFQEVREKRGLAYAVYSFTSMFADTGEIGLYVGTQPRNLGISLEVIAAELDRIRGERVSDAELDRARENLKGRLVLALESTASRMNRLGSSLLGDIPLLSIEEVIERVDAVTADEVQELATELFDPARLSAGAVGPDGDRLATALRPLGPALTEVAA